MFKYLFILFFFVFSSFSSASSSQDSYTKTIRNFLRGYIISFPDFEKYKNKRCSISFYISRSGDLLNVESDFKIGPDYDFDFCYDLVYFIKSTVKKIPAPPSKLDYDRFKKFSIDIVSPVR